MAGKTDKITELYQSALKEITSDSEKWTSFLKSACQNFRLPFDEQLLVYVQWTIVNNVDTKRRKEKRLK